MITKQKAIEIADVTYPHNGWPGRDDQRFIAKSLLDALDVAHAFPDEATLAEIASVAREVLRLGGGGPYRDLALRLATACRAAGLVKP